jgi:hypothetical protein
MCLVTRYFNAYIQEALDNVRDESSTRVLKHGEKIDMLRFTDDIGILAESEQDLIERYDG